MWVPDAQTWALAFPIAILILSAYAAIRLYFDKEHYRR